MHDVVPTTNEPSASGAPALRGADKVTALLLAMGKVSADKIIRSFDEDEIRMVARAASGLPPVSQDALRDLVGELEGLLEGGEELVGSEEEAENLIAGVVPEDRAVAIMSDVRGQPGRLVWPKLETFEGGPLAEMVKDEHPQVAAYILSRLSSDKAASAMRELDPALRQELSWRMLVSKAPSKEAITLVERRLLEKLRVMSEKVGAQGPIRLSAVLNRLERDQVQEVLGSLEQTHPEEVPRVKERLFRFEDVVKLSAADRGRLIEALTSEKLILALRMVDQEVQQVVLSAMSARARRLVEQELSTPVPVQESEIKEQQREIAALALEMAERGLIKINAGQE